VVERGGLENRCAFGYPGFESLPLRTIGRDIDADLGCEVSELGYDALGIG
jgi:hypothetical protein